MAVPQSRVSRLIRATPWALYEALMDPVALAQWLPPGRMTGQVHAFDGHVGGGFEMSLFYPAGETQMLGKSAELEDRTRVRIVALEPPRRIVWAITFVSDDPAFAGEMTMTWTFDPAHGGMVTAVTVASDHLPAGLRPEDNDEGARLSLQQLAAFVEAPATPV